MYLTRKIHINSSETIEEIMGVSGEIWSEVTKWYWRFVKRQGVWPSKSNIQRWLCQSSNWNGLHSQSIQAVVDQFYDALSSYFENKGNDPNLNPPHKQKEHNKVVFKSSAIRIRDGVLKLSRGRGYSPIEVDWGEKPKPKRVELIYNNGQYTLCCQYKVKPVDRTTGSKVAGIDLGEIHLASVFDGKECFLINGKELRAKRHYQNKLKAKLQSKLDQKQKYSKRYNQLKQSKQEQLANLDNQVQDILHKLSRTLVEMCLERDVSTLVIGDVRGIRQDIDYGPETNQKLHQWVHGTFRRMIEYKAKLAGMDVELIDESYTSQKCPSCGKSNKTSTRNYRCTDCDLSIHRDKLGAINIRKKYLREVSGKRVSEYSGIWQPPRGVRYNPHMTCNSASRSKPRPIRAAAS